MSGFGPGFTGDTCVATHPDADHIGGADTVIKDFGVKTVIDSGQDHTINTHLDYLAAIQVSSTAFKAAKEGQDISPDPSVSVKVLHADSQASDLNEESIVLKVSYGDADYLLTGDAGIEMENEIMAKYDLDAEVLKVSHHGSSTGTSAAFLAEVSLSDAILSYGEGNTYGHPHSEVLKRLLDYCVDVWKTPKGNIETWTDGQEIHFKQGIDEPPTVEDPIEGSSTIGNANKDLSGKQLESKIAALTA